MIGGTSGPSWHNHHGLAPAFDSVPDLFRTEQTLGGLCKGQGRGARALTKPENSRPMLVPPSLCFIRSLLSLPYASITSRKFRDPGQHIQNSFLIYFSVIHVNDPGCREFHLVRLRETAHTDPGCRLLGQPQHNNKHPFRNS